MKIPAFPSDFALKLATKKFIAIRTKGTETMQDPLGYQQSVDAISRNIEKQKETINHIKIVLSNITNLRNRNDWKGWLSSPNVTNDIAIPWMLLPNVREMVIEQLTKDLQALYEKLEELRKDV